MEAELKRQKIHSDYLAQGPILDKFVGHCDGEVAFCKMDMKEPGTTSIK
jgi:hypothetical protein